MCSEEHHPDHPKTVKSNQAPLTLPSQGRPFQQVAQRLPPAPWGAEELLSTVCEVTVATEVEGPGQGSGGAEVAQPIGPQGTVSQVALPDCVTPVTLPVCVSGGPGGDPGEWCSVPSTAPCSEDATDLGCCPPLGSLRDGNKGIDGNPG